jgi:hypothetical protein
VTPAGGDWTVTSDGTDWVLVFQNSPASTALQAMRITAGGVVEQPSSVIVPATYFMRSNVHAAYTNGVFLLKWNDFEDTMSIRFGQDLVPLDPAPNLLVENAQLGGLVASPTQFYMVWKQADADLPASGCRLAREHGGVKLDGNGRNISGTSNPVTPPDVAWDGARFRVSWGTSPTSVRLGRVNAAGAVLRPERHRGPRSAARPARVDRGRRRAASCGATSRAVRPRRLQRARERVEQAGPNFPLSSGAPMQSRADVAVGSNGYMVVYRSDISGLERIVAQPLDAAGNPTTPAPVTLVQGDDVFNLGFPTVAWNGSVYPRDLAVRDWNRRGSASARTERSSIRPTST